jgi:hypothetical protein
VTDGGQLGTLHGAVSGPGFHLLLCGPGAGWPAACVAELKNRWPDLVTVHRLTRNDAPGVLHDHTGEASRRLRLRDSAQVHYLTRPDGHIGYRSGGTDLAGVHAYLETSLGS